MQTGSEDVLDMIQHVEEQIENGRWNALGWWKASSTSSDSKPAVVKCHLVVLEKVARVMR